MQSHYSLTPIESGDPFPYAERNETEVAAEERLRIHNTRALSLHTQWLENQSNLDDTPLRPNDLGLLGWVNLLLAHKIARTRSAIQKQIEIVEGVATDSNCPEMLSESNLGTLKETLMRNLTS